jgi:Trp operon repressor
MDSNDVLRKMLRANLHQRQYAELVGVVFAQWGRGPEF